MPRSPFTASAAPRISAATALVPGATSRKRLPKFSRLSTPPAAPASRIGVLACPPESFTPISEAHASLREKFMTDKNLDIRTPETETLPGQSENTAAGDSNANPQERAQKRSGGPRTPEGKARSSQNSRRHGILARVVIATRRVRRLRCSPEGISRGLLSSRRRRKGSRRGTCLPALPASEMYGRRRFHLRPRA
jgi:hypothetical protein